MINKFEYFRKIAIESIEEALKKHEMKDYLSIADNIDNFETLLDEKDIHQGSLLHITLEFLSGWSDSTAHDWLYYEPLKKDDWPRMAKIILSNLKENKEITDPNILSEFRFIPKLKISIIDKVRIFFS